MKTASLPDQETKRINEKKPLHTRVWRSLGVNEHPETASWSTQPVMRCDGGRCREEDRTMISLAKMCKI